MSSSNGLAYFATAVNYDHKMLMKYTINLYLYIEQA
jgi:hypothetical protein